MTKYFEKLADLEAALKAMGYKQINVSYWRTVDKKLVVVSANFSGWYAV